jgi:hypothetical protein
MGDDQGALVIDQRSGTPTHKRFGLGVEPE